MSPTKKPRSSSKSERQYRALVGDSPPPLEKPETLPAPILPTLDKGQIGELYKFLRPAEQKQVDAILRSYDRSHPVSFVREYVKAKPTDYQAEILETLFTQRRIAVRSCHGSGKTAVAGWATLFALSSFGNDFKIITTASSWRQLTKFLWPEIHKWARRIKWDRLGIWPDFLTQSIKWADGEVLAVASDRHELIEGAHAEKLLYILDEAKAIPDTTWDAVEGAFSTGDVYCLAISTPGDRSGRFFDIHRRAPGFEDWAIRHVTIEEAIRAGRVRQDWVDQRRNQWGEDSPVFQARVLGEFPQLSDDALISLTWVENAIERWKSERKPPESGDVYSGLDVARYGRSRSVCVTRKSHFVLDIDSWSGNSVPDTAGRAKRIAQSYEARLLVDEIGIGAGVLDTLLLQNVNAQGINVSEPARDKEHFANLRAELFWGLRERFRSGNIALPDNDDLIIELTSMKYKVNAKGQIVIESKEEIIKREGKSPDTADALCLSFAPGAGFMLAFA